MAQNHKEMLCSSCTSELQRIRQLVKTSCEKFGVDESRTNMVVLAIDEACANVIRHGYQYSKQGTICIEAYGEEGYCVFLIKDKCPQITEAELVPRKDEPLKPGGLGLHLMYEVMDSVTLKPYDGEGNRLELKIKI